MEQIPTALGGDPVGNWVGTAPAVCVYADSAMRAGAQELALDVVSTGRLDLQSGGAYVLSYVLSVQISFKVLGAPLEISLRDTSDESGSYAIVESDLQLLSSVSADTLSFTAASDTLTLFRNVSLGDLSTLAASVAPDAPPPVGMITLVRSALSADFDGSGLVDFTDFLLFAQGFGTVAGEAEFDSRFDLNKDSAVDFADFLEFAQQCG